MRPWPLTLVPAALAATGLLVAADFSTWRDGRAELDGYRLTVTRYGEPRSGHAVLIYVTEPFSESKRVKVEDAERNPRDTFEALKLNLIREFQTGIYGYHAMTSVFDRADDMTPVKVTFSSAEWCGHVYEELRFDPGRVAQELASYFEDESARRTLAAPAGGVAEENLYILLRGLRGDYLAPGAKAGVPFLESAFHRRLTHQPLAWTQAEIERLRGSEVVAVPAGRFETARYEVRIAGGRVGRFFVEIAPPHRLVRWSWEPGTRSGEAAESAELLGSERLAYWQLNAGGDERYLEALGLGPEGATTAPPSRRGDRRP